MIEYLEYTIIFYAIGTIKLSVDLFGHILWIHVLILILGILYAIIPM